MDKSNYESTLQNLAGRFRCLWIHKRLAWCNLLTSSVGLSGAGTSGRTPDISTEYPRALTLKGSDARLGSLQAG